MKTPMDELLPTPAPGFDDPIGLLRACHQRMLQHCEWLEKFIEAALKQGIDADLEKAARQVHRYFCTAAKLHHQDEEEDFFPILNRTSIKLAEIIYQLKQDHQHQDQLWQALEVQLRNPKKIADLASLQSLAAEFCQHIRMHIKTEEAEFLTMAQHLLSAAQLKTIGNAMAERRSAPTA